MWRRRGALHVLLGGRLRHPPPPQRTNGCRCRHQVSLPLSAREGRLTPAGGPSSSIKPSPMMRMIMTGPPFATVRGTGVGGGGDGRGGEGGKREPPQLTPHPAATRDRPLGACSARRAAADRLLQAPPCRRRRGEPTRVTGRRVAQRPRRKRPVPRGYRTGR